MLFKNIFPAADPAPASRKPEPTVIRYDRIPVPVHLYIESRKNSRISLLKTRANVRLPRFLTRSQRQVELERLLDWAERLIDKKGLYPNHAAGKSGTDYYGEGEVCIAGDTWRLEFEEREIDHIRVKLIPASSALYFQGKFTARSSGNPNEAIRKLMLKCLCKHYLNHIINLVSQINDKTFNFTYNAVRLKYLKSRWGSCSAKGNINLSLRLLLLPHEVCEYVIIHELAHLKEMNHSKAFWKLVEHHSPDYRKHEKWLNKNGHLYDL